MQIAKLSKRNRDSLMHTSYERSSTLHGSDLGLAPGDELTMGLDKLDNGCMMCSIV
jgi:hypothetical protein